MRRLSLLMLMFVLFVAQPALAKAGAKQARQETAVPNVFLSSPVGGQALQGVVAIDGNTAVAMFQTTTLAFTYHGDTTGAWFLIHESDSPIAYDTIAQWDTTTITDGDYDLRLTISLTDGSQVWADVYGLRVRNYSPVETDTPVPPTATIAPPATLAGDTQEAASPTPSVTQTATRTASPVPPTITPLPTNPVEFSQSTLLNTVGKGALTALGLFTLLGIYLAGRNLLKRPRRKRKS
jgi:hypothetical protein